MAMYKIPMMMGFLIVYFFSVKKYFSMRKNITFKEKYKMLAVIGFLGGAVFLSFRRAFPFFTQFLTLDVIIEFFVFIHLFITVSYFFIGINLEK